MIEYALVYAIGAVAAYAWVIRPIDCHSRRGAGLALGSPGSCAHHGAAKAL